MLLDAQIRQMVETTARITRGYAIILHTVISRRMTRNLLRREIVVPRNLSTDPFPEVAAERSEYPRERFDCFRPRPCVTRIPAELLRIPRPPFDSLQPPFHHRILFFPPCLNRSDENIRPAKIRGESRGMKSLEVFRVRFVTRQTTIESLFLPICGGRESISVSFSIGTKWSSTERGQDFGDVRLTRSLLRRWWAGSAKVKIRDGDRCLEITRRMDGGPISKRGKGGARVPLFSNP